MDPSKLSLQIEDYRVRYPDEGVCVDRFHSLLREHADAFYRTCWAGHITGSAWVLNRARTHVLLTHHGKLNRWLQLGGHCHGEEDVMRCATREAEEEGGLRVRPVSPLILDLDVHEIPARKQDPAHHHFDVRYVFEPVGSEDFQISSESLDLAWVDLTDLTDFTVEESILRMHRKSVALGICAGSP
ncbi:MAG: NUDIX hydrolase [Proteobacteria bacterium]|nr:NUDIX hydrolase [Pseudomonadota bacterium]